jgi:glycosyltransferase involved in cell wall biosynthesis
MKALYLRTVFWFGFKSGGSVAHTSGVINSLSNLLKLDIFSNDDLAGVKPKINIISPGFLKMIPFRLGEIFYSMKIIKNLKAKIQNYNFIYQRYSGLSFAGAYLSKKYDIPLILEFNSSDVWQMKHWYKQSSPLKTLLARTVNSIKLPVVSYIEEYNLRNAFLIVVVSSSLKENLIKKGIHSEKILVNPNGVDPQKYSPEIKGDEIKKKYKLEHYQVVGFIGTFREWHGVTQMAESINLFFQLNPEKKETVKFLLIGDGRLMPSVKELIYKGGYSDNVIFAGLVPQDQGPKYMGACDILLSPHIKNPDGTKFFGSPTKLFEYMAMGKPIIASNLDQIGDILKHKKTAYLVTPGNIEQLANAIRLLFEDNELREEIGKNARIEILEKYIWDKNIERLIKKLNVVTPRTGLCYKSTSFAN